MSATLAGRSNASRFRIVTQNTPAWIAELAGNANQPYPIADDRALIRINVPKDMPLRRMNWVIYVNAANFPVEEKVTGLDLLRKRPAMTPKAIAVLAR
jgi:hypothetical protein